MSKESNRIVLSGIRPTGHLHLGNYFGALRNFVEMQSGYRCFFFIADWHSLTTHPVPGALCASVKDVLSEYLGCGLDPEKSTIYIQSDVPEVLELYLYLNMNAYLGELQRCTSFKEKIRQHPDNINAGLLTYPTLMAADILIHRAAFVPVGKDQEQHLEMTRTFAQRFNRMYDREVFPLPQAFEDGRELVKIPGLDGGGKMGKSDGNAIYLVDSDDEITHKVRRAVSDSGPTRPGEPKSVAVENLFALLRAVSTAETVDYFEGEYQACRIRYGDLKKQLAEDMIRMVTPIRERILSYRQDEGLLDEVAARGAARARESARETLGLVREAIGMGR